MRGDEQVLAVEPLAVGRQHQRALVDDAETLGVAVMRGAQHGRAARRSSRVDPTWRGPPTIGVPCSMRLIAPASMKRHDDVSLKVTVECAAVARATCRQFSRLVAGTPQLTTMR